MKNTIKFQELWFLDGNYNKPIKVQGFQTLIKDSIWEPKKGYIFIDPNTKAMNHTTNNNEIFLNEKDAITCFRKQLIEHIAFCKKYAKGYEKDAIKYEELLK